ncbi:sigma-70 family RNA polymerase sigma factor [bacterium]|nr:sigma-70 family RNA polymerase sigma factor [bacterium]MCI0604424.1 sigma-70 family RNA polymerase sigma factor [bacterium]
MDTPSSKPVTQLLLAWGNGDREALDKLIPLVYDELYRLAARQMKGEKRGHTLQTTALVNEAYCKLVDLKRIQWQNRAQFFAIAAQMMRRILIDHAKTHTRAKRGGHAQKISFDDTAYLSESRAAEMIALDEALTGLAKRDSLKSRIVEMKFFAGLTFEEIAHVEQVSSRTIEREWRKAKAWLYNAIRQ